MSHSKISITSSEFKVNDPETPVELRFLIKLLYDGCDDYVFTEENLKNCSFNGPMFTEAIRLGIAQNRGPIQGPDLGRVKHYDYSTIQKCTDSFSKHCLIKNVIGGKVFRGDLDGREVTVKTWDFRLPPGPHIFASPYKFVTELLMLTKGEIRPKPGTIMHPMEEILKTNDNLVKVIGYSCENIYAVVYDLKSKQTVDEVITTDMFDWKSRMRLAMEMAQLVKLIHDHGHSIGSIDTQNIMIDEEGNFKLFVVGMHLLIGPKEQSSITFKNYDTYFSESHFARRAPEMHPDVEFDFQKVDIYAFGILLWELITKHVVSGLIHHDKMGRGSLVDASFGVKDEVGDKITDLLYSCLNFYPDKRPEMSYVCDVLEKINEELLHPLKKPKLENDDDDK